MTFGKKYSTKCRRLTAQSMRQSRKSLEEIFLELTASDKPISADEVPNTPEDKDTDAGKSNETNVNRHQQKYRKNRIMIKGREITMTAIYKRELKSYLMHPW